MGNDGGSIPKRRELVKEAARLPTTSELKATALESLAHAWSTCPVSSEPLDPHNTVADARGRLYNYEAILRCLMPSVSADNNNTTTTTTTTDGGEGRESLQSQEAAEFARSGIRSLKDVVKLKFALQKAEESGGRGGREVRICPLSRKELGPAVRAVFLVPCGHVFAEGAMKELIAAEEAQQSSSKLCTECSAAFETRDMVPLLPVEQADVDKCARRIDELKALGLAHNLKKDKSAGDKKKKRKAAGAAEEADGTNGAGHKEAREKKEKKQKRDRDDISGRINNSMTATLTAKVLAEQDERNRQRKMAAAAR